MEKITLEQIVTTLTFLITIIGLISSLLVSIKKVFIKQLEPLNQTIKQLDINQCRNYLVDFLADIENEIPKDECQIKRAYEVYDHYINDLNGNSYIHDKWEKLMKKRGEPWNNLSHGKH